MASHAQRTISAAMVAACALGMLTATPVTRAQEPAPETATTTSTTVTTTRTTSPATSSGEAGGIKDVSLHTRPQMISVFTGLHYGHFAGYGFPLLIGGRYSIPIVPDGFIPSINDEFALEFGLDFDFTFLSSIYADSVLVGFGIPADAMWDFHFSDKFDAYAKLGFVFGTVFNSGYDGFWWTFRSAVGLRLKLNEAMYFRAEVGYPAIMAGLGFAF
jgi:hypothetical protein